MRQAVYAVLAIVVSAVTFPSYAQLDGALPIPVLRNVQVQARASHDAAQGTYQYHYAITNRRPTPELLTEFGSISAAVVPPAAIRMHLSSSSATGRGLFVEMRERLPPEAVSMVPVGISTPTGWYGAIGARGFAAFNPGVPPQPGRSGDTFPPGQSRSGFVLTSFTTPTIREMTLTPDWIYVSTNPEGISEEESQRAVEIADSLPDHVCTLGPSGVIPGSYEHWNELRDSLQRAISLGWVSDAALAQTLTNRLADAREALDGSDGTLAKNRLQQLLTTLAASNATQRRPEVNDLVSLNAQNLISTTPDTPVPGCDLMCSLIARTFDLIGPFHHGATFMRRSSVAMPA